MFCLILPFNTHLLIMVRVNTEKTKITPHKNPSNLRPDYIFISLNINHFFASPGGTRRMSWKALISASKSDRKGARKNCFESCRKLLINNQKRTFNERRGSIVEAHGGGWRGNWKYQELPLDADILNQSINKTNYIDHSNSVIITK